MTNQGKQQLIIWWILWAAFQTGIFIFYHFLGGHTARPQPPTAESSAWMAALAPVALSFIIRWFALPHVQRAQTALVVFVIGIAMAEATCFMGLFVFPAHSKELFLLSALGIFQYIPLFAHRYYP